MGKPTEKKTSAYFVYSVQIGWATNVPRFFFLLWLHGMAQNWCQAFCRRHVVFQCSTLEQCLINVPIWTLMTASYKSGHLDITSVKPGHLGITRAKPGHLDITSAKPGHVGNTENICRDTGPGRWKPGLSQWNRTSGSADLVGRGSKNNCTLTEAMPPLNVETFVLPM